MATLTGATRMVIKVEVPDLSQEDARALLREYFITLDNGELTEWIIENGQQPAELEEKFQEDAETEITCEWFFRQMMIAIGGDPANAKVYFGV